jgi:outer membrane protein assembly factor BamA
MNAVWTKRWWVDMFVMRLFSIIKAVPAILKGRDLQFLGEPCVLPDYVRYVVLSMIILTWPLVAQDSDATLDKTSNTLVAMPLINNNPTMKTGFGGIGMYLFPVSRADTISPPSTLMLVGLYSTNKSYVFGLPAALFFAEDKYRITAAVFATRMNLDFTYDLEGNDIKLVYSELRTVYAAEFSRAIAQNLFLGLMYSGIDTRYKFDQGSDEENDSTRELFNLLEIRDSFVSSLGLKASFDSRDYIYYPQKGLYAVLRSMVFAKWLGSSNDYTNFMYTLRYYHLLKQKHVLAAQLSGGHSLGDVPFAGYQTYGMRNTLRGYPTGKYRGKHMVGIQAEYRWNFYQRWGMVAFGGIGSVWGGGSNQEKEIYEKEFLPSIGTGLRFMLSREKKINMRLDYAWGVNGNEGVYLGIMEAF